MRPPRYRFPDEVRNTARSMASRMSREGALPEDDAALDAWIAARPEVRDPLERGGYGTHFGSGDLLPLLRVFAGVAPPAADAPARSPRPGWLLVAAVAAALALLVVLLATGALTGG